MTDNQFWLTGAVLAVLLTLCGASLLILNIVATWRKITVLVPATQFITRGELDQQTAMLRVDMQKLETDMKIEVKRVEQSLSEDLKELHIYTHDRFHEQAGMLQTIQNQQALMRHEQLKNIVEAVKPLDDKINKLGEALVRIEARMNGGNGV